jgi:hypothetical protein
MKLSATPRFEAARCAAALYTMALVLLAGCARHASADESNAMSTTAQAASAAAPSAGAPPAASAANPAPVAARVEVPTSLERSCREICDRSRRLKCENTAECMPNCLAMGSLTPCTDKMTVFFHCLVEQPLQNWECSPDGVAAVRPGFCENEQASAVGCMETHMN